MERNRVRAFSPQCQPIHGRRRRVKVRSLVLASLAACLVAWAAVAGCGRTEEDAANTGGSATRPPTVVVAPPQLPTTRPASEPATPQQSYLYFQYTNGDGAAAVDAAAGPAATAANVPPSSTPWGISKAFPQARLMLTDKKDGPVTAKLFSDDPEDALSQKWAGDRYYLEMRLSAESLAQLDGEQWGITASPGELPETTNGVYLKGDRYHLVPVNVLVRFDGQAPNVTVRLGGQFLQTDTMDPTAPPKSVIVQGMLIPKVETKN